MRLWQAHAIFEIGNAIGQVPLVVPEGWDNSFTPTFTVFIDGDYEDPEDDLYMGAVAEFASEEDDATFTVRVEAGLDDKTITVSLMEGRTRDRSFLLTKMIDVPMPTDDGLAKGIALLAKVGSEVAQEVAAKVTEHLATRKDMTAG